MARVLGVGCIEEHADESLIQEATHVEYNGLEDLQGRIDEIRSKRASDQLVPWELLNVTQSNLLDPKLPAQYRDIIVKEYGAESDTRHYDYVSNEQGPARNFTVKFLIYPIAAGSTGIDLSSPEILNRIDSNLGFLVKRVGAERLLIEPQGLSEHLLARGSLTGLLDDHDIGLALDLDEIGTWADHLGTTSAELLDTLPLERVRKVRLSAYSCDLLKDLFQNDLMEALEAVTYTGRDTADIQTIKSLLKSAGATLIDDALSVEYYFAQYRRFKHNAVFKDIRYCFQALNNIKSYVQNWITRKFEALDSLLETESNYTEQTVVNGTAVIEAGAYVDPAATVGAGSVIKRGAVVSWGAVVEDEAVIGDRVYVAKGARIKGGRIENNVYVGESVLIEGPCTIKTNVWIDDGVKLIRNSVIENLCYIGQDTVIDGATLGNRVILERCCELRPGAYIRKDTIFGDYVTFRSEAKNTVIMDGEPIRDPESGEEVVAGSESGHYGYCGDSILGRMVNEGAGDMNSNVKNDWGEARVTIDGWKLASGLAKFGSIIGDFTTVGCLTVLEPGTLIGRGCNVYGAKVRSWLQTATVYAEDQIPRQRWADSLPREQHSLGGRSGSVYTTVKEFEESGIKRIGTRHRIR